MTVPAVAEFETHDICTKSQSQCLVLFAGSTERVAAAGRDVVAGLDLYQHPGHH